MPLPDSTPRSPHAGPLAALLRQLRAEEAHLQQVREWVQRWPESLCFAPPPESASSHFARLEQTALRLRHERDRLIEQLQLVPGPAQSHRFRDFDWTNNDRALVGRATARVHRAAARLVLAVQAARGALGVWAGVLHELSGTAPHAGTYSASRGFTPLFRRAAAAT